MSTKKSRTIGPRISEKCREWLKRNFQTITGGAEMVLEGTMVNYHRALQEMKGRFSENELKSMVEVMNATMLIPMMLGQHLPLSIQDSITMDGLAEKWELDPKDFATRLAHCTNFQLATLEWWANGFWYGAGPDRLERDLDEYVKLLLA